MFINISHGSVRDAQVEIPEDSPLTPLILIRCLAVAYVKYVLNNHSVSVDTIDRDLRQAMIEANRVCMHDESTFASFESVITSDEHWLWAMQDVFLNKRLECIAKCKHKNRPQSEIDRLLDLFGVTEERVSNWIDKQHREALSQFHNYIESMKERDRFPLNICESDGQIHREPFTFKYSKFEVIQHGECLLSEESTGKITTKMNGGNLNVMIPKSKLDPYIASEFKFGEISESGDRLMWSRDIMNLRDELPKKGIPDILSLFYKGGNLAKIQFTLYHGIGSVVIFYI